MPLSLRNRTVNRELSWLSFNYRVLQEAMDKDVPLIERLRFLGIFSNNLDEFFRVRVATMKRIKAISKKKELIGDKTASEVLDDIHEEVLRQKEIFDAVYEDISFQLEQQGVHIVDEENLTEEQAAFVDEYYRINVAPLLVPIMLKSVPEFPYLRDKSIYLAVKLSSKTEGVKKQYALIEVPSELSPRFVVLPDNNGNKYIIYLDDILRFNLDKIFGIFDYDSLEAYTIKLTRDAELDLDDDVSQGFYEKMRKSLKQRRKGQPVRFIFDHEMPKDLLNYLTNKLKIEDDENLIDGGRHHNSKDFMSFPNVGNSNLEWESIEALDHEKFQQSKSILAAIEKDDILLQYPYHNFRSFIHYMREAAIHPDVKEIKITLYRVARQSRVINALIAAVKNGKSVTVMIELRARFDEENNLKWSRKLQDAGVKVIFGIPEMKVHCKLAIVTKVVEGIPKHHAVISTGNFNESTAKFYSDFALFTCNKDICDEAIKVFNFIERPYLHHRFKHLLVAPEAMRKQYLRMINREIRNAQNGLEASIFIKMNSLVDEALIRKLYQASMAGVKIRLIVRGICSLMPGIKGLSENIEVRSILDKYLEHGRVFIFENKAIGSSDIYISSADWMERNLDYRIEVSCPIYDKNIRAQICDYMETQWADNVKARIIDSEQKNQYVKRRKNAKPIRAQVELFNKIQGEKVAE